MHKSISLSKVLPNPFRRMERYPVDESKIDSLVQSMNKTGFWENVVAREVRGNAELAYGHHRRIAYERKYGKSAKINLIIKDISDDDMLRMMADENMEHWGWTALIEQETVRSVVMAYAEGRIELKGPKQQGSGGGMRNAPSFLKIGFKDLKTYSNPKPYNAESIAAFLGWWSGKQVAPRVRNALVCLQAVEEGLLDEKDFEGLTSGQAVFLAKEARAVEQSYVKAATRAPKEHQKTMAAKGKQVARATVKKVVENIAKPGKNGSKKSKGTVPSKAPPLTQAQVTDKMRAAHAAVQSEATREKIDRRKLSNVREFVSKLTRSLNKVLVSDNRWERLQNVADLREHIDDLEKNNLTVALRNLIDRCQAMMDAINGQMPKIKR